MKIPLLLLLLALANAPVVRAADSAAPNPPPPIDLPGDDIEIPGLPGGNGNGKPEKPEKPDRPTPPGQEKKDLVKDLINDFRAKAEEYKNSQQDLVKKYKNATAEERARIREQIKELKEQFREAKDQFQSEMKSDKIREEFKRVIEHKKELPQSVERPARE